MGVHVCVAVGDMIELMGTIQQLCGYVCVWLCVYAIAYPAGICLCCVHDCLRGLRSGVPWRFLHLRCCRRKWPPLGQSLGSVRATSVVLLAGTLRPEPQRGAWICVAVGWRLHTMCLKPLCRWIRDIIFIQAVAQRWAVRTAISWVFRRALSDCTCRQRRRSWTRVVLYRTAQVTLLRRGPRLLRLRSRRSHSFAGGLDSEALFENLPGTASLRGLPASCLRV